ncbi:hypothetical protein ILUMI_19999 [Ignelater luminosus]|uniref:Uncharacterized protein n=1 Tax=Ignelater luminosus TaxID=2038154 RepID=A0A8K0CH56_IGNLU|nr:hypothetical protein ILUMI_19999 [Ignelater luminosus]
MGGYEDRDPFLEFLRRYKRRHSDWDVMKVAVEGAKRRGSMTKPQRQKYLLDIFEGTPRRTKRNDKIVEGKRRRRSKSTKKKKSKKGGRKSRRRRRRYSQAGGVGSRLGRRYSAAFNDTWMEDLDLDKNYKEDFEEYYI